MLSNKFQILSNNYVLIQVIQVQVIERVFREPLNKPVKVFKKTVHTFPFLCLLSYYSSELLLKVNLHI